MPSAHFAFMEYVKRFSVLRSHRRGEIGTPGDIDSRAAYRRAPYIDSVCATRRCRSIGRDRSPAGRLDWQAPAVKVASWTLQQVTNGPILGLRSYPILSP